MNIIIVPLLMLLLSSYAFANQNSENEQKSHELLELWGHYYDGVHLHHLGRYRDAIEQFDLAIKRNPNCLVYYAKGKLDPVLVFGTQKNVLTIN